jgi:DNA excision repair protein ERCC-2
VVQAAGRVIRTEQDAGLLYLFDERFAQPAVRKLLPAWWHVMPSRVGAVPAQGPAANLPVRKEA